MTGPGKGEGDLGRPGTSRRGEGTLGVVVGCFVRLVGATFLLFDSESEGGPEYHSNTPMSPPSSRLPPVGRPAGTSVLEVEVPSPTDARPSRGAAAGGGPTFCASDVGRPGPGTLFLYVDESFPKHWG